MKNNINLMIIVCFFGGLQMISGKDGGGDREAGDARAIRLLSFSEVSEIQRMSQISIISQ
jgi:hypothetical protein